MIRRMLRPLLILGFMLPLAGQAADAPRIAITPVTSPGGITAWLWQDETVPVIAVRAAVRGGARLDPKPGVSRLWNTLTGIAAGDFDAATLARKWEAASASLSVVRGATTDLINLSLPRSSLAATGDLAALVLTRPVISADSLALARTSVRRRLIEADRQPGQRAEDLLTLLSLGDRVPALTAKPLPGLDGITEADLHAVHRDRLVRANLVVSVAGAISPAELGPFLDRVFGGLPEGQKPPRPPSLPEAPAPGVYHISIPGAPQSVVLTALPGLRRTSPDYWAALVLDHTLGGATFTSRLKQEVREKRGLVYSTGSSLRTGGLRPAWVTTAALAPAKVPEAVAITRQIWADLRDHGLTQAELDAARDYYLGSLTVSLTSTGAMADFVSGLQLDGLPPTYYDDRRAALTALTLDQVNAAAKRLIDPSALVVIIAGETTPDLPPSLPLPPGF